MQLAVEPMGKKYKYSVTYVRLVVEHNYIQSCLKSLSNQQLSRKLVRWYVLSTPSGVVTSL